MSRIQTLAEYLGTDQPEERSADPMPRLEDITDSKAFALAVLDSLEFRRFIISSLQLGELPSGVICRLMDYAWGRPAERVEHTGKDGAPIVTEIRRVFVHKTSEDLVEHIERSELPSKLTH